ncbi:MAG: hypothetical protein AAFQ01_03270 [Bacteroidota bacterium]
MKSSKTMFLALILIFISQLLMSFGYEFLMSQQPIDYAHWALLVGAVLLFGLWFQLPDHSTKSIGLTIMSFGIAGIAGMCMIDFILWAADGQPELKNELFGLIFNTPAIQIPFLIVGPTLFYAGICIATYGLFSAYQWQVICVNAGALLIGLGHMIFQNAMIPVLGALLLFVGLVAILSPVKLKTSKA